MHANDDVSVAVAPGTIHGIVGENGAGKSTLMSIVYGYYQADGGEIRVGGTPVAIKGPQDAIGHGIGMVHQHFMLVDTFTVLENVVLGVEQGYLLRSTLKEARQELERIEREYGLDVDPDAIVGSLPVGLQQRVEILKALYRGADILILDEPTGVLTPQEVDDLFRILRALRDQGPDHHPHHPQAARDHGADRPRHRDARRPRGRSCGDGRDRPRSARRDDGGPQRIAPREQGRG